MNYNNINMDFIGKNFGYEDPNGISMSLLGTALGDM